MADKIIVQWDQRVFRTLEDAASVAPALTAEWRLLQTTLQLYRTSVLGLKEEPRALAWGAADADEGEWYHCTKCD